MSVEFDPQLQTASPHHEDVPQSPELPGDHIHWIADKAGELAAVHTFLADHPREQATITIEQLVQISDRTRHAAEELVINSVLNGHISRRQGAEMLGVHKMTLGRWVTARQAEMQTPQAS